MKFKFLAIFLALLAALIIVPAALAAEGDPATITIVNQTSYDWTFWLTSHTPSKLTTQFAVHNGATVVIEVPADTYDFHLVRAGGDRRWVNSPLQAEAGSTKTIAIVDDKAPKVTVTGDPPPATAAMATVTIVNQTNYDWAFWLTSHSPAKKVTEFSVSAGGTVIVAVPANAYDYHLVRAGGDRSWLNNGLSLDANGTATITIVDDKAPTVTVSGSPPPDTGPQATLEIANKTGYDWAFWITSHSHSSTARNWFVRTDVIRDLNGPPIPAFLDRGQLRAAFAVHSGATVKLGGPADHYDFHLRRADGERSLLNSPISLGDGDTGVITIVDDKAPTITTQVFSQAMP